MSAEAVRYSKPGAIATITLNRLRKANTLRQGDAPVAGLESRGELRSLFHDGE